VASQLDDELFRVVTYLIGSASTAVAETLPLASYRLLDAATRLIAMAESHDALSSDTFLTHIREEIADHGTMVMWDQAGFLRWLPTLEHEMVHEARERNLSEPRP
jgi:Family of unknown function (DUF6092)